MPQDLKPLTSVRFFAAMWVTLFDYWPSLGATSPALVGKGYLGVDLFFTLSGFILCHVYLTGFGERRFKYAEFLWARLSRIYPVHLVTILGLGVMATGALALGLHSGAKVLVWPSLIPHLLLLNGWGLAPLGGWNHPSWSISAEWFAYLAFPAFAAVAWKLRRRPIAAVAAACLLIVVLQEAFLRLAGFPLTRAAIQWGALRIAPCFALGCAVNLLWRAKPLRTEKPRRAGGRRRVRRLRRAGLGGRDRLRRHGLRPRQPFQHGLPPPDCARVRLPRRGQLLALYDLHPLAASGGERRAQALAPAGRQPAADRVARHAGGPAPGGDGVASPGGASGADGHAPPRRPVPAPSAPRCPARERAHLPELSPIL
jgi:hypothetical protein